LSWRNGERFDGVWTKWYDNGQKNSEEGYKSGIPVGVNTYWYDNGQKRSVGTYTKNHKTDNITKHGK
jgi:antitoxin component YwqK of YwqJK toxin-antitoxin module